MRLGLLVLLSLALCAAQTSDNQSHAYFPAPYFDEGENLSSQNCGNETNWRKWKNVLVEIKRAGYFCMAPLIIISQRSILGLGHCRRGFTSASDLRVFPYNCGGRTTEEECIRQSVKVLDVIEIAINLTASKTLMIYITEKMPSEVVAPICLFNRDNVMDLKLQTESSYFEWHSLLSVPPNEGIKAVLSNCSRVLNRTELEHLKTNRIPIQNILCVENGTNFNKYLINFYKGRYFLRGIRYYGLERIPVYLDILAYMDEITRHAKDIYALRPIPQTKQPRGFTAPDNLSFPNCGSNPTSTRRKRGNDDSSEESKGTKFILHGTIAQRGNHPWHAFIKNSETRTTCGGTLISPTVVLTAAHCIDESEAEDFIVTIGMYDRRQRTAPGVQRRLVRSLTVHPKYNDTETKSDVGIMILSEKISITAHARPICLWNEDSNLTRVAGTEAMAVGFGLVDNHTRTDELQEARLPIRDHKECYLSSRRFFAKHLRPGDNFCAGYTNGTTTCNGDSGGSLSVEKDGRWFIRGIVSFGKSKKVKLVDGNEAWYCHQNYYSLFADVASYMDWIVENTPEISFRN
ncbi:transmembrane protease serine 9-like [Cloeon dipterum]|uniref:transmembrane protease serine 9-like n=1 Tax=Cloeon dipterum TaxID=197152 RepID=UPI00322017A1